MEDEDQLQNLAKRLVNIYNACKWSKTKLHIRKKRRTFYNSQSESITEIESESSARTVFVYDRKIRKRTDKNPKILENPFKDLEENIFSENIKEFPVEQSVNVYTCKKCRHEPGATFEQVDKRKSFDPKEKNSNLVICVTPAEKALRNAAKGCCCTSPKNFYGPLPIKKKSAIKPPQAVNKDCICPCDPVEPDPNQPVGHQLPPHPPEFFYPYYPPPQDLIKIPKSNKEEKIENVPAWAPKKKCGCPPGIRTASCCCPYTPPKTDTCCQRHLHPADRGTSPNTKNYCEGAVSANCACQCCPHFSILSCPPPPGYHSNNCCCKYEEFSIFDNSYEDDSVSRMRTDKIIMPSMYYNERDQAATPSAQLSYVMSEEVKNEMLNDNLSDERQNVAVERSVNTTSSIFQGSHSSKRGMPSTGTQASKTHPFSPSTGTQASKGFMTPPTGGMHEAKTSSIPQSVKARPCYCKKKDANDGMMATSSTSIPHSQTYSSRRTKHVVEKTCQTTCCGCPHTQRIPTKNPSTLTYEHFTPVQDPSTSTYPSSRAYNISNPVYGPVSAMDQNQIRRPHHVPAAAPVLIPPAHAEHVLRYPSDNNLVPSAMTEEKVIAKYSPNPNPLYSNYLSPTNTNQLYPGYPGNYVGAPPVPGGMVPPPRFVDHSALLRSTSTPLCCRQLATKTGGGDETTIAGINVDTQAEIYATLRKIETSMRDEADMHCRNVRCIVDQVCKQGGDIKELKVLVAGVVEDKKTPTCKQVGRKIKKLEKRKEKEDKKKRERENELREREKEEGITSKSPQACCKCGEKKRRSTGCCGKCCEKRCGGLCGTCCGGCCPKCCDFCCHPFEKCCPCCCLLAKCCDKCWSWKCIPRRRKKKCKCSN